MMIMMLKFSPTITIICLGLMVDDDLHPDIAFDETDNAPQLAAMDVAMHNQRFPGDA